MTTEDLIFHSRRKFQGNWSNGWEFEENAAQHQKLLFQVSEQLGKQVIAFAVLDKRSKVSDNCYAECAAVELANIGSDRLNQKV